MITVSCELSVTAVILFFLSSFVMSLFCFVLFCFFIFRDDTSLFLFSLIFKNLFLHIFFMFSICNRMGPRAIDLFRLYILFSQYRSCDDTQEI